MKPSKTQPPVERPKSFGAFLKHRPDTPDATGDMVRDARLDRHIGKLTSWKAVDDYLSRRGVDDELRAALQVAWREYRPQRAPRPRGA